MRTILRFTLASLVALMLVVVALPAVVSASPGYCEVNDFCNFKHRAFNLGDPDNRCWAIAAQDADYTNGSAADDAWINCTTQVKISSDGVNDDTTSVINQHLSRTEKWCRSKNYGTPCTSVSPGGVGIPDLGQVSGVGNDQASSHRFV
jgi:hypothetical protein